VLYCYILDCLYFTKDAYLDKKRLLHKPSEQQRLLEEVPRVIPEMEDSKDTEVQVTTRDRSTRKSTVAFQGTNAESIVSLKRCSEEKYKGTNGTRASFLKSCAEEKIKGFAFAYMIGISVLNFYRRLILLFWF